MNDNVTMGSQPEASASPTAETKKSTNKLLPTARQRRERLIRGVLSVLAVLLLISGFATPQIVQAIEFQSRGEFVQELQSRYSTLENQSQRNDALTIITGLKLQQVNRFQTSIEETLKLADSPLTAEQRTQLTEASTVLNEVSTSLDSYRTFPLLSGATETVQDCRDEGPNESNIELFSLSGASWPTDDIEYALDIFNVAVPIHRELPTDHSKMTNAQFSDVKKDLEDTENVLKKQTARAQKIDGDLSDLKLAVASAFTIVQTAAPQIIATANDLFDRAAEFEVDTAPLEQAVANVEQALSDGPFMLDDNGRVKLAPSTIPEGSFLVENVSDINRGIVIAQTLTTFLNRYATVNEDITELEEVREAERLAQEEYERQLAYEQQLLEEQRQQEEEQQQTPPPTTDPVDPTPGDQDPPGDETEPPVEPTEPQPGPDPDPEAQP